MLMVFGLDTILAYTGVAEYLNYPYKTNLRIVRICAKTKKTG